MSTLLDRLFAMGFKRDSPEAAFWRWFRAHAAAVAAIRRGDEPIANELAAELHKVDPRLTFELGVRVRPHELIVSADGVQAAFPTVERLVAAAPALPGWRVIAFRPRKSFGNITLGDGTRLTADQLAFEVLRSRADGKLDVAIYAPGIGGADEKTMKLAIYLLLDDALGEYDVETRLAGIAFRPWATRPETARPFTELAAVVDER